MLQVLSKQVHPDPASVQDLLKRTFQARRKILQDPGNDTSVCSFLEMYPFLDNYNQIQREFTEIVKEHWQSSFLDIKLKWLEVGPKVIDVAKADQGNGRVCAVLQKIKDDSDEGTLSLLALRVLSCMLPDSQSKIEEDRVLKIVPSNADLVQEANLLPTKQCGLIGQETPTGNLSDVYLVVENKILTKIDKKQKL